MLPANRWNLATSVVTAMVALLVACNPAAESAAPASPTQSTAASGAASRPASASLEPSLAPSAEASEGSASFAPPGTPVVTIRSRSFGPPEINVAVGEVVFVNEDSDPHTVTEGENGVAFPNARFDQFVDVGDSVAITFAEPGDYQITCQFHAEMRLLVHVL